MKAIFAIAALLLFLGVAGAGTVSITGTCSTGAINNASNYATFSLINSGNQTATGLLVLPKFGGATAINSSEPLQSLAPGQNVTMKFYFNNFSTPGSYAGSFTVAYAQGASSFFALFPCVLSFVNYTSGIVQISAINQSGNTISVSLVNLGAIPYNVSVGMLLPPEFHAYPTNQSVTAQPGAAQEVRFSLSEPPISQASYTIAAAVSYNANGMHYASIKQFLLSFYKGAAGAGQLAQYLPYVAALAVILVIVSMMAFSIIRKRRRAHPAAGESKNE